MKKILLSILTLTAIVSVFGQNKLLESKQLMNRSLYPQKPIRSVQFVGDKQFVYFQDTVLFLGTEKKVNPLVSTGELDSALSAAGYGHLSNLQDIKVLDENTIRLYVSGKLFSYNVAEHKMSLLLDCGQAYWNLCFDKSYKNYAYPKDNTLVVVSGDKTKVFGDENADVVYGQSVHRNEFGINGGIFWAPDGNRLAFYRMDQSMVTDYPMVNTRSRIATPAPFKYPMAGMKSHEVTVGIYDLQSGSTLYLETGKDTSVAEREMFLTNLTWSPDGQYLYIAKVNRGQNHMWLERYDVATGKLDKVLFEEQNDRYVEPCEGLYFLPNRPDKFLWFSMRDGYKHLYLYGTDGNLQKQLTQGSYEVEEVVGFDAKGANVFVYANKDNLAGRAFYRINIKNGEMVRLTTAEGTHNVTMNAAGTRFFDAYSSVSVPARGLLLDAKGKALQTLYDASSPLEEYAMPGIKLGTIKAADGTTDLYYRLITPPNMEAGKKYPTLVYVYGGPHSQLVTDSWLAGGNLYFTFLAQQGYVVFTLDNRGTDNRGFEFESCTHRQLGTIEMSDQMEGVKFLQSLPYVDKDRMGVEGWSFGGFMTITMKLAHPEIFKVACAGGPVIDWKWYEVMYGERYMDTPQENPEGYANASLLSKAKDLEGRLLVIHGAEDNTVVWQNSIEFIERCINNGKLVDYFIYPHHEHNVQGRERVHLYEKMFDYYETYLK